RDNGAPQTRDRTPSPRHPGEEPAPNTIRGRGPGQPVRMLPTQNWIPACDGMTADVVRLRDGRCGRAGGGVATPPPTFRNMPERHPCTKSRTDNCEEAKQSRGGTHRSEPSLDCFASARNDGWKVLHTRERSKGHHASSR